MVENLGIGSASVRARPDRGPRAGGRRRCGRRGAFERSKMATRGRELVERAGMRLHLRAQAPRAGLRSRRYVRPFRPRPRRRGASMMSKPAHVRRRRPVRAGAPDRTRRAAPARRLARRTVQQFESARHGVGGILGFDGAGIGGVDPDRRLASSRSHAGSGTRRRASPRWIAIRRSSAPAAPADAWPQGVRRRHP